MSWRSVPGSFGHFRAAPVYIHQYICVTPSRALGAFGALGALGAFGALSIPQLSAGFLSTGVLLRCDADAWGVRWGGWGGVVGVG